MTPSTALLDTLAFGDDAAERAHGLIAERSDVIQGGLGQAARRLLPLEVRGWEGGRLKFTFKVDPARQNYFTVRLWGSDVSHNRLVLFCEGKQIGYRHLGDIDILDNGSDEPQHNGRFIYNTSPLPLSLTKGKSQLNFEIRSSGYTWGYANRFEDYQKPMTEPTRGIYRIYTHVDPCLVPPADEVQGEAPNEPPVRETPGPEVLAQVKKRVGDSIAGVLRDKRPLGQVSMQFVARAYHVKWTPAFQNPRVVEQVVAGLDHLFVRFRKDPKLAQADPSTPNPEWFGFGLAGDSIRLLAQPLQPLLEAEIDDGNGAKIKRRTAWSEMLQASREWNRRNRRQYTNQSMIKDLNIYRANRGVAAIDPENALPESRMLDYLYESIGLQPWLGSETESGPAKPLGDSFYQLTDKGLTKELGFVGYYGEVLDWMTELYDATRDPGQLGNAKIKGQIVKAARARSYFRYPALDAKGNRAMRAETEVGWRDVHFPGAVTYGQRFTWDASGIAAAAATLDPDLIGYAQQMFTDNQFFASLAGSLESRAFRTTIGLQNVPDDYEQVMAQAPTGRRLPMSPGQPGFAWADEENGVVAIKDGDEILYASLYWRARPAVNFLGRIHHITPRFARTAVVCENIQFEPGGMTYKRPNWINFGFANGGPRYPGKMNSAHAGEELPIAKIPDGIAFKPGQESIHAGKGSFYTLRYGAFLIVMNATKDKTFELSPPDEVKQARDLVSGRDITFNGPAKVGPRSTIVLRLP